MRTETPNSAPQSHGGIFATTHWSVVLAAGELGSSKSAEALERLCRIYWYPLYAYVRRKGYGPHHAQDLTQDFFARLLEKHAIRGIRREGGKFRSFLLTALNHFLINECEHQRAQKRDQRNYYHGALYVVNSDRGTVVKVPVLPNGAPGTIEVAVHLPEPFPGPFPPGAEGLALDVHGNFYLAMSSHNVVMRLSPDGQSWNLIATAADNLDIPANVAFGTGKGERSSLFITSQALFPGGVGPGLTKVDTGVAGLPLP